MDGAVAIVAVTAVCQVAIGLFAGQGAAVRVAVAVLVGVDVPYLCVDGVLIDLVVAVVVQPVTELLGAGRDGVVVIVAVDVIGIAVTVGVLHAGVGERGAVLFFTTAESGQHEE